MAHTYTRVNWAGSGAHVSATSLNVMDAGIDNANADLTTHAASSSEHTGLSKSGAGSYVGAGTTTTIQIGFNPYLALLFDRNSIGYWTLVANSGGLGLNMVGLTGQAIGLTTGGFSVTGNLGNQFGHQYWWVAWGV